MQLFYSRTRPTLSGPILQGCFHVRSRGRHVVLLAGLARPSLVSARRRAVEAERITRPISKGAERDEFRIEVEEDDLDSLADYGDISIAFTIERILDVRANATGGFSMSERAAATSSVKDYDAIEHPRSWVDKIDISNWGVFAARKDNRRVGGALVAFRTPGVHMLEGRDDLAVLWDIRVRPETRGRGIGRALLEAVERWSVSHGVAWLKVETQNINVPACRFYGRNGFTLRQANANAYPSFPEEIQLLWYKALR